MKTYQQDYTAYQTYALLDFNISFEKDIPADDISRNVIEVTESGSLTVVSNFLLTKSLKTLIISMLLSFFYCQIR